MNFREHKGAALLVTVIIILVLSVIAVTATNTNQLQQLLIRNNQHQLLVFNTSFDELESQLEVFERLEQQARSSQVIEMLVANGSGASVETRVFGESDDEFVLRLENHKPDLSKSLRLTYRRLLGEYRIKTDVADQDGVVDLVEVDGRDAFCYEFELLSETQLIGSTVRSRQHRVFEWVVVPSGVNTLDHAFRSQGDMIEGGGNAATVTNEDALKLLNPTPGPTPNSDADTDEKCDPKFTCRCFSDTHDTVLDDGKRFYKKSWWQAMPSS